MPSVVACHIDRSTTPYAKFDRRGNGIYTLRYQVMTDGMMGPLSILNGAASSTPHPLPSQYSTYSHLSDVDASSFAQPDGFTVERDPETVTRYFVTVEFTPLDPLDTDNDGGPVNQEPNPLLRSPVFWWDRECRTTVTEKDRDDKAILNKCGRMYDQTVEVSDNCGVLVVEFNVATLAEIIIFGNTYERHTNESPWNIGGGTVPTQNAICREVSSGPPQIDNGVNYYRCLMRFAFAGAGKDGTPNVWCRNLVERGFGCFRAGFDDPIVLDAQGQKKYFASGTDPVCLAEDGTKLPDGEDPIITAWDIHPQANFNALPFSG